MPLKHELDCIKIKELGNDRITKLFRFTENEGIEAFVGHEFIYQNFLFSLNAAAKKFY